MNIALLVVSSAVGAAVPSKSGSPFSLKWRHSIAAPYTPLSVGVVTAKDTVCDGGGSHNTRTLVN
jgi:hypothetical protein